MAGIFEELPEVYRNFPVEDFGDKMILPGLVDLHVHAGQYAFRGLGMDQELLAWLEQNAFPEESRFADASYAARAYPIFVDALRRSATTRACIFATLHRPATLQLMQLLEDAGMPVMWARSTWTGTAPIHCGKQRRNLWRKHGAGWRRAAPSPRCVPSLPRGSFPAVPMR